MYESGLKGSSPELALTPTSITWNVAFSRPPDLVDGNRNTFLIAVQSASGLGSLVFGLQ